MRWTGRRESSNVDDRRGIGGPIAVGGGILGVLALLFNYLMGDSSTPLPLPGQNGAPVNTERSAREDSLASFVKVVLAETEDVWNQYFAQTGENYEEPVLVLFTSQTQSGCGFASSATGPFYCPADRKVYIDLSFYDDLQNRFGAGGDFAMAYVVAHEVGHHIQNLMGTSQKMAKLRGQVSQAEYNRYSVMVELQADFLAGMWAHYTANKNLLDPDDIEEAMRAANAIGDDRLQRESRGDVDPESFTHGTSEQRMHWFMKGYKTGDLRQGDTFSDPGLRRGY